MPAVSVGLGPWLRARGRKAWAFSAGGVVAIILVLAVLAGAFRWLSG
jgi:hypothetical protein